MRPNKRTCQQPDSFDGSSTLTEIAEWTICDELESIGPVRRIAASG